jgi:hypothetical protein
MRSESDAELCYRQFFLPACKLLQHAERFKEHFSVLKICLQFCTETLACLCTPNLVKQGRCTAAALLLYDECELNSIRLDAA